MRNKRRRFNLQVVLACFIGLTLGTSSAAPLSLEKALGALYHAADAVRRGQSHALSLNDITDPTEAKFQWIDAPEVKPDRWAFSTLPIGTN